MCAMGQTGDDTWGPEKLWVILIKKWSWQLVLRKTHDSQQRSRSYPKCPPNFLVTYFGLFVDSWASSGFYSWSLHPLRTFTELFSLHCWLSYPGVYVEPKFIGPDLSCRAFCMPNYLLGISTWRKLRYQQLYIFESKLTSLWFFYQWHHHPPWVPQPPSPSPVIYKQSTNISWPSHFSPRTLTLLQFRGHYLPPG